MPVLIQINDRMLNKAGLLPEQFTGNKMLGHRDMQSLMEAHDHLNVFLKDF